MAEAIPDEDSRMPPESRLVPAGHDEPVAFRQVSVWENKEIFIRKVFEDDSQKGCELLFKQYYGPLCSHAARIVYAKQVAEDLVGEVFYTFWQREHYKHVTTSYRAYLFTAVRHRALTYLRGEFARQNTLTDMAGADMAQAPAAPDQSLHYEELSLKIEKVIQSLAHQSQRIFIMSRFEGKQNRAIADELQISVKTVEAHITKTLAVLRKALRAEWLLLLLAGFLG